MACCGKNSTVFPVENHSEARSTTTPRAPSARYFEYVGGTAITVIGPITGLKYRFTSTGARLPVDERDAPSLAGVPNLRRVPGSD